jgi:hypothetical protein
MLQRRFRPFVLAVGIGALMLAGCDPFSHDPFRPTPVAVPLPAPVVPPPKAVIAGTLDITQTGTDNQIEYWFVVNLTETGNVAATVTSVSIAFDNGWGGECIFAADKLDQKRLPANGTLTLAPLKCTDGGQPFNVSVTARLTDDNGYKPSVSLRRVFQ